MSHSLAYIFANETQRRKFSELSFSSAQQCYKSKSIFVSLLDGSVSSQQTVNGLDSRLFYQIRPSFDSVSHLYNSHHRDVRATKLKSRPAQHFGLCEADNSFQIQVAASAVAARIPIPPAHRDVFTTCKTSDRDKLTDFSSIQSENHSVKVHRVNSSHTRRTHSCLDATSEPSQAPH